MLTKQKGMEEVNHFNKRRKNHEKRICRTKIGRQKKRFVERQDTNLVKGCQSNGFESGSTVWSAKTANDSNIALQLNYSIHGFFFGVCGEISGNFGIVMKIQVPWMTMRSLDVLDCPITEFDIYPECSYAPRGLQLFLDEFLENTDK